jgi:hypothetical protein
MAKVWEKSVHSGTELLMLLALADYSDDQGNSYPGVASLARKCRMTTRNVNFILVAIQSSGELCVLRNEGPRGTNRYRIMLALLGISKPLKPTSPLKGPSPLKPPSLSPEAHFPKPLKPTSDEPSLSHQEPSTAKVTTNGFDVFYKSYPRKYGKAAAVKAFAKSKANSVMAIILADIDRRISSGEWAADKAQFIPHPATYLNGKRWEDEQDVGSGGTAGGILPGAI